MRRQLSKKVPMTIFILIVGLIGITLTPGIIDEFQAKRSAADVLDRLVEQNYGKAFESVYFYDEASDLNPTITYERAKSKWTKRVKDLSEKGTYVVDYKNLIVKLDDSYPVGTVDLIIMENGIENVIEDVRLWFGRTEGSWKLGNLYDHDVGQETAWEKALSGHVK